MPSFLHTFAFALLAQPLPFALLYLLIHVVPSFLSPLSHLQKKKGSKGMFGVFFIGKEAGIMGGENL